MLGCALKKVATLRVYTFVRALYIHPLFQWKRGISYKKIVDFFSEYKKSPPLKKGVAFYLNFLRRRKFIAIFYPRGGAFSPSPVELFLIKKSTIFL
jgi:hypothetical protein